MGQVITCRHGMLHNVPWGDVGHVLVIEGSVIKMVCLCGRDIVLYRERSDEPLIQVPVYTAPEEGGYPFVEPGEDMVDGGADMTVIRRLTTTWLD